MALSLTLKVSLVSQKEGWAVKLVAKFKVGPVSPMKYSTDWLSVGKVVVAVSHGSIIVTFQEVLVKILFAG